MSADFVSERVMMLETAMPAIDSKAKRITIAAILLTVSLATAGCRICAQCNDLEYPSYGGAWERTLRETGRVGSVFAPAGARTIELSPRDSESQQGGGDPEDGDDSADAERGRAADEPLSESEADSVEPPSEVEQRRQFEERSRELRQRRLDDIEEQREQELRDRTLEDIGVNVIPGPPAPPDLH